jgi:hypothetical protein
VGGNAMSSIRNLPDFLGIGAQRSGSTWFYENIKHHPEIWVPPLKEIHFFDHLGKRKIEIRPYRRHLKRRIWAYSTGLFRPRYLNLAWDYHFFLGKRDFNWYKNIFLPEKGQIAGEVTPAYSTLSKEIVQKIYYINPKLKVIFLMRDPMERIWSSAIKGLARDRNKSAKFISNDDFMRKITAQSAILRGNYLRTLEIWESIFPSEQIHIDFMDEIRDNPKEVLLRAFNFLEVSADKKYIPVNVSQKKNSTDGYKIPIPPKIELHLARFYLPQLEMLSKRFGGHTVKWLTHAKEILAREHNG